ncbi:MAG: 30S ribosomal protein S30e [Desulfurococcaceae archaeon]|nr:30S ribosomal protein S30e [Desulfurococcaceae archaeon]
MPTHGSLTKAGKVRSATPKIPPKPKKNKPPRVRNRVEYVRRFLKAAAVESPAGF